MGSSAEEKSWGRESVRERLLMKLRKIGSHCRHLPWANGRRIRS
jgi:hypothetical protein